MKQTATNIFLIGLIVFAIQPLVQSQLFAQFTLNKTDYESLLNTNTNLTIYSYSDPDPVISIIEQTGENEIWDLSLFAEEDSVSGTGTIEFFTSFEGKPGSDLSHFSSANIMAESYTEATVEMNGTTVDFNQTFYSYSSLTDNNLVDYGFVSNDSFSSSELIARNTPAQTSYPFPLTWQTMWDDTYTFETSQDGTVTSSTEFTVSSEVDGYGTVEIGDISIPVLRVTETQTNEESGLVFETITVRFIDATGYEVANASVDIDTFSPSGDYERASASIQLILTDEQMAVSSENSPDIPASISLDQNYPNPFNPTTQISYQLNSPSEVSLSIYSITGQKVGTLINGEFKQAGEYSVSFDASNLASGIYIYRLRAGDQMFTRKMTLVK